MFQPDLLAAAPVGRTAGALTGRHALPALPAWVNLKTAARLGIGLGTDVSLDLGDAIGSRGWWLGFGTCLALCGTALTLGTMVPPLTMIARAPLTPSQREMLRPLIIAPLARGAATGAPALPSSRFVEALAEPPERPRLELTATINGRDSFEGLLRRAGVGQGDVAAVVALVRPEANLGALPRGSAVDLVLGRRATKSQPRPLERLGFRAAFDLRLLVTRSDAGLQLKRIPIAVDATPLRVQGLVGRSLTRALLGAGIPSRLAGDYLRTIAYVVDLQHGIGKRDRFDIVVEQDRAETGEVRHGNLLFAALARGKGDPVEVGRWQFGGKGEYFRASGESAKKGLMRTPVEGARLTSGFGMRFHPLLAYSRMHQGVDFGAPSGSPIYAAAGGRVAYAAPHGGHGNYVMLQHNKELRTGYAHLSRYAVRAGQTVAQGQVIGYVGSTGMSTGPHLHYETWLRGRPVNPVQLKFLGGTQLSGDALAQFLAQMNRMRALAISGSAVPPPKADRRRGRRR